VPKREIETLNIFAACDSEDPSVTGHGHVLHDDISFAGGELCVWFDLEISAPVHKIKIVRLLCLITTRTKRQQHHNLQRPTT
jgi:hypothetical protein